MVHQVELPATCFPAARSFAARRCVAILLLSLGMLSGGKTWSQGFASSEAVGKMTVAAGLQVKLFASEPEVRQPIFVKCDDRGRLWTIQYLQYPNPAGLKRTQVDRWSRTTYDRVPPPPPHGPRGADKITILEDQDGDGRADQIKDFVDGLNLVTGVAFGQGGVYVLNVPYLLFYPDQDRDDVPDADPEVLLSGFGMEDAQSLSNHLTWGPDGWLYGVNGSTTTCRVRGLEFQQGVWRYHPRSREFELFCEGGSNCYGITFDENGELYYSTNGGPFVHAVQGGYFFKSFGKHGPLHNLYAYHYFSQLECDLVPGGPPTGGTVYLGDSFPALYRGKFIAGNFLGHTASWWQMEPRGSTVRARFGGLLFDSHDTWFGPTDLCLGPDGSMYLSDFHDRRTAHPDPDANWDRTNGRIYKIESTETPPGVPVEIGKLSSAELVACLRRSNGWLADRARRELHDRRDPAVVPHLRNMARQKRDGLQALQGLWALNGVHGIDEPLATELLTHPYPYVRLWVVRLLGDGKIVSDSMLQQLEILAANDGNPAVLAQLAASAKRLSGEQGLAIIEQLLDRTASLEDERITWLIWWAIENHALSNSDQLLEMFTRPEAWHRKTWRENALRLVRRWSADGTPIGYDSCLSLLQSVPAEQRLRAHESFRQGLLERAISLHGIGQGNLFTQYAAVDEPLDQVSRSYQAPTIELRDYVNRLWQSDRNGLLVLELALLMEIDEAKEHLKQSLAEAANQSAERVAAQLNLLSRFGDSGNIRLFLKYAADTEKEQVRLASIRGLTRFDSLRITETLLDLYPAASEVVQSGLRTLFFSRALSGRAFLELVQAGTIDANEIPVCEVGHLSLHEDETIEALVLEIWGNIGPGSSEEKLAQMRRYNNDLRLTEGNPTQGKALFRKHCGNCHVLHREGKKIGPDLTSANRKDRAALLASIVDPGAVVRREYLSYMLVTETGRIITGLLLEKNAASVTVLDQKLQSIKVPRDQIAELTVLEQSFMPERILENLSSDERRHLFAYLQQ